MTRPLFVFALALTTAALLPTTALAGPITIYTGTDVGVAFGSPLPNSNTAAAALDAAIVGMAQFVKTIDFESAPLGAVGAPEAVGSDATLGVGNTPNSSISNTQNNNGMFDTTPGGSHYFAFLTQFVNLGVTTTATANFSFASPTDAFGAYFTGLGSDTTFTLNFSDGSSQALAVPGTGTGFNDAMFFGFTDPGSAIASVTLTNAYTAPANNFGYFVGVDDVQFAQTPEPGSILLLGSGLLTLATRLRRRS